MANGDVVAVHSNTEGKFFFVAIRDEMARLLVVVPMVDAKGSSGFPKRYEAAKTRKLVIPRNVILCPVGAEDSNGGFTCTANDHSRVVAAMKAVTAKPEQPQSDETPPQPQPQATAAPARPSRSPSSSSSSTESDANEESSSSSTSTHATIPSPIKRTAPKRPAPPPPEPSAKKPKPAPPPVSSPPAVTAAQEAKQMISVLRKSLCVKSLMYGGAEGTSDIGGMRPRLLVLERNLNKLTDAEKLSLRVSMRSSIDDSICALQVTNPPLFASAFSLFYRLLGPTTYMSALVNLIRSQPTDMVEPSIREAFGQYPVVDDLQDEPSPSLPGSVAMPLESKQQQKEVIEL
ncbi:hypothetical protein DIPPA_19446 [Diplonema papillatum]|nr:hypothetical protein DIPPA_19446 [Diplonema papillatum]